VAPAETAGRSPAGTLGPRPRPATGQAAMAMKPTAAQNVCGSEPPLPARSGFAATSMVAAPTAIRIRRPARAAGRSDSAVTT
jgi:hypothetical protein